MKKKRKYYAVLGFLLMILFFPALPAEAAKTIYNSPYVTFSPDGKAWTTNAGDKNIQWYRYGETVATGIESKLRALETGEHYYDKPRTGVVPVGYWRVEWAEGQCIHNAYPPNKNGALVTQYHGVSFARNNCFRKHYSGWLAYCADCGERITDCLIYMNRDAAKSIDYVQLSEDEAHPWFYYYLCPFCNNLEQGVDLDPHACKAVSINRYRVIYDKNLTGEDYGNGGYMENSIHMYNNSTVYEGQTVTPITHLSVNDYRRNGYRFVSWNTNPDGSGTSYADGAEIFNLTSENWNGDQSDLTGTITLYAQWEETENTLQIDPNGGSYAGNSRVTSITQKYRTTYTVNASMVSAPSGYRVHYECNGGNPLGDKVSGMHFMEWSMVQPFEGKFSTSRNLYQFSASNAHVDTLRAIYAPNSITLPQPVRSGYSFGGWYYDAAFQYPAGGAGDSITPAKDLTLYAQWVELVLQSTDNYSVYAGSGAVDLAWWQPDGQGKTYLLYQSRNSGMTDAKRITAVDDIGSTVSVSRSFGRTGSAEVYVVPYSGIYTLSLSGAQGSNYGTRTGGKGGSVTLKVWLAKGEKLTVTVGGKDGYNGGGTGSKFGNGGGKTTVSSDKKGLIAVAGGGGAASTMGNGGAGGSSASLTADGAGGSGAAGGGGGYKGGNAGEEVRHTHEAGCYRKGTVKAGASFYATLVNKSQYSESGGTQTPQVTANADSAELTNWTPNTLTQHIQVGNTSTYLATPFSGTLTFPYGGSMWGGDGISHSSTVTVYFIHENGSVTTQQVQPETAAKFSESYIVTDHREWADHDVKYDLYKVSLANFTGTLTTNQHVSWEGTNRLTGATEYYGVDAGYKLEGSFSFDVAEDVKGIYIAQDITFTTNTSWVTNGIGDVSYTYSGIVCGYEEGELISSKPAYGGSSYVDQTAVLSSDMTAGDRAGHGTVTLRSEMVGYTEEHEMKKVKATDLAAPDAVDGGSVEQQPAGTGKITVTWQKPSDNGTDYYHQAETYLQGSTALLCRSNITKNTLVSGVKGYYYALDAQPGTRAGAGAAFLAATAANASLMIDVKEEAQYLHLAAVDVAGNISATTHIRIDAGSVRWKVYTRQLQIGNGENVFAAAEPKTYFVRCDGSTPIHLTNSAYMDGQPTGDYQLNYTLYKTEIRGRADSAGENQIYTPSAADVSAAVEISADRLRYAVSGATALKLYPYSLTRRSDRGRQLEAEQKFTLDRGMHGKYISVVPGVGAVYTKAGGEEIYYSDASEDAANGITLIGDCAGPEITGLEELADREFINRIEETVTVSVTASDELSGVADFYLKIKNKDNFSEQIFYPEGGAITLDITKAEPLFSGDFTVTGYAVDNVGNTTEIAYDVTEFALEARIERMLEPHDPVFKRAESGILYVTTYGYADRVEITFPKAMRELDEKLKKTIVIRYEEGQKEYRQEAQVQFMVPLYLPEDGDYTIKVRAYKAGKELLESPQMITVSGTVLDEIRTRLR